MKIDLTPSEIQEAIAYYLTSRGFTVRRHEIGGSVSYNRHIEIKTDCNWGGTVTKAVVDVEAMPTQEGFPRDPYKS